MSCLGSGVRRLGSGLGLGLVFGLRFSVKLGLRFSFPFCLCIVLHCRLVSSLLALPSLVVSDCHVFSYRTRRSLSPSGLSSLSPLFFSCLLLPCLLLSSLGITCCVLLCFFVGLIICLLCQSVSARGAEEKDVCGARPFLCAAAKRRHVLFFLALHIIFFCRSERGPVFSFP